MDGERVRAVYDEDTDTLFVDIDNRIEVYPDYLQTDVPSEPLTFREIAGVWYWVIVFGTAFIVAMFVSIAGTALFG